MYNNKLIDQDQQRRNAKGPIVRRS